MRRYIRRATRCAEAINTLLAEPKSPRRVYGLQGNCSMAKETVSPDCRLSLNRLLRPSAGG
jgi:hypothetical protein